MNSSEPRSGRRRQSKAEQVDRCRREVEACRRAGADPNLTAAEKLGAMQGEVDWLVALQVAEEDDAYRSLLNRLSFERRTLRPDARHDSPLAHSTPKVLG